MLNRALTTCCVVLLLAQASTGTAQPRTSGARRSRPAAARHPNNGSARGRDPQRPARQAAGANGLGQRSRSITRPVMPAYESLAQRLGRGRPFRNVVLVGVQHLLGSTGGLLHGLARGGLRPAETHIAGKTYSQHPAVIEALRQQGFHIYPAGREPGSDTTLSYMHANMGVLGHMVLPDVRTFNSPVARMIANIRRQLAADRTGTRRILVIDEGGALIEAIHRQHPDLHNRVIAVEQTTAGINAIERFAHELRFPVVDVASSSAKVIHESPMIGRSVAQTTISTTERLRRQGARISEGANHLVLGYGNVGRATAATLRRLGRPVTVYDPSAQAREAAQRDGLRVFETLEEALPTGNVVIAASNQVRLQGRALLDLPDYACLVNASSSSTVFNPQPAAVGYAPMGPPNLASAEARRDRDWQFRLRNGRTLYLAKQGTVINFDERTDPIPPRYIQLTRGLLHLAAHQAVQLPGGARGIVPLDGAAEQAWVSQVNQDLARTGESLASPSF